VYDTAGGSTLDVSFAAVRRFGRLVSSWAGEPHSLAPLSFKDGSFSSVFTLITHLTCEGRGHHVSILGETARLVEAGKLVPRLDPRDFGLDSVADAYDAITNRTANGKLVVSIG
jgi:NADPH:quinone reductase